MNMTYYNAFAETLFIIKCLPSNDQSKISKSFINFLEENQNKDYKVNINPNLNLEKQELLEETKELLKEIYISYFTTENEKQKILKYNKMIENIEEDLKRQKYNKNIFADTKGIKSVKESTTSTAIIEYKEPLFKRIMEKIKNFFKM